MAGRIKAVGRGWRAFRRWCVVCQTGIEPAPAPLKAVHCGFQPLVKDQPDMKRGALSKVMKAPTGSCFRDRMRPKVIKAHLLWQTGSRWLPRRVYLGIRHTESCAVLSGRQTMTTFDTRVRRQDARICSFNMHCIAHRRGASARRRRWIACLGVATLSSEGSAGVVRDCAGLTGLTVQKKL